MTTEVEEPLSKLPGSQARSLVEAVSLRDWSRARGCISQHRLSQPQVEHLLAWTLRALRRGEIQGPSVKRPLDVPSLPLVSAWRCDVSLPKHLRMQLLWRLNLPDGRSVTLQLSLAEFHKVRYNIAMLLRELIALKSNSLCHK